MPVRVMAVNKASSLMAETRLVLRVPALRQTQPASRGSETRSLPGPSRQVSARWTKQNRAGYSPIMLTALATLKTQDDIQAVLQLFRQSVNAKASQVLALGAGEPGQPSHL